MPTYNMFNCICLLRSAFFLLTNVNHFAIRLSSISLSVPKEQQRIGIYTNKHKLIQQLLNFSFLPNCGYLTWAIITTPEQFFLMSGTEVECQSSGYMGLVP